MHYLRFLRPPTLSGSDGRLSLKLVLAIVTDLGDSFLQPPAPVKLGAILQQSSGEDGPVSHTVLGAAPGQADTLVWKSGMRVLKCDLSLPRGLAAAVYASGQAKVVVIPNSGQLQGASVAHVIDADHHQGRIMPVIARLYVPGGDYDHVCIRSLRLPNPASYPPAESDLRLPVFDLEEDLGDSIARHVWDGGLTALAALAADFCLQDGSTGATMPAVRSILLGGQAEAGLRILELGCGVGTLGLGLASMLRMEGWSEPRGGVSVLLTDVEEAKERASANIRRWQVASYGPREAVLETASTLPVAVDYEVLDWEDGRVGRFGPAVRSTPWDLVVLSDCTYNTDTIPSLVQTLSELQAAISRQGMPKTQVFLATKPRHSSETMAFELLSEAKWRIVETATVPIPFLGGDDQAVELYLFEK